MKQILLMRHAKAGGNFGAEDFERPLTEKGLKDAKAMGVFLKNSGFNPDCIISSPAKRAKQTAIGCVKGASLDESMISWNRELYYGTTDDYLKTIQNASENCERLLLIGHNPLMENIAVKLAGSANGSSIIMPSGGLICFQNMATSWKMIRPEMCAIKWMMIPELFERVSD